MISMALSQVCAYEESQISGPQYSVVSMRLRDLGVTPVQAEGLVFAALSPAGRAGILPAYQSRG